MPFISRFFRFSAYLFGGWPMYLLMGMAKRDDYHFWPNDKLCKNSEERGQMIESIVWIAGFVSLLSFIGYAQGFAFVLVYYGLPYFVFSSWISLVTHLHHTHPDVPWYRDPDWSYLRGALSTVDRNYGLIEDIHHNIGTHIVHHLFHKIPHYNLKEATEAIKPILGEYHKKSEETVLKTVTKIWANCRFVSDNGTVMFYQG
jgi:omega-3 fatty acid desaturase (delta-15 desaturase)